MACPSSEYVFAYAARGALVFAALALVAVAVAAPEFSREGDHYVLRGTPLEMTWDAGTGALLLVRQAKTGLDLLAGAQRPFGLNGDGGPIFGQSIANARRLGALMLDGEWDFHIEDGKWGKLKVPGAWEDQGITMVTPKDPAPNWEPYNGNGYYRRTFDLPAAMRGQDLVLVLQQVDDFDWTSVNGKQIGHTGQEVKNWWAVPRHYTVPGSLLKPTGNELDVRVYDRGGQGGLLGSVLLMTREQLKEWESQRLELAGARMERHEGDVRVVLSYEAHGWTAQEVYDVATAGPGFFSRRVELVPGHGAGTGDFHGGQMSLGQIAAGLLKEGHIAAPWTWPPVDEPLSDLAAGGDVSESASQATCGVGLWAPKAHLALAVGQFWEHDWNRLACSGRDGAVSVTGYFDCDGPIKPGLKIPMGGQFLLVSDATGTAAAGPRAALRAIGEGWQRLGFARAPIPRWADALALYEAYPGGTMGSSLRDLRDPTGKVPPLLNFERLQLPIIHRLGMNALWFMPLWPGLYGPSNYFAIDPSLGTKAEFRTVVDAAHGDGIRVLCDLIPHGPTESSGLAKEHPDFVSRHADGSILYWWGCLGCDYANPGWQDYMANVATYWVKQAGIDGYRVDCASGSPANWRPFDDNLPSWSGQWGGLGVMRASRQALDALKPGCVMLGEAANPSLLSQAQYIYDWATESILFHILDTPRAQWVAQTRRWLAYQRLALPGDAARGLMHFTENHDQLHSVWQLGPDLARPVWALCALAEGFPLLYQEQETGFEDLWRELLAIRRALPELGAGTADYLGVECNRPDVLAFLRQDRSRASLVAINFSRRQQTCTLRWPAAPASLVEAFAAPTGRSLAVKRTGGRGLAVTVTVPADGWRVVALRRKGVASPFGGPVAGMEPTPARPKAPHWSGLHATVTVRQGGAEKTFDLGAGRTADQSAGQIVAATVEADGGWKLVWRDGLLAGVTVGDTDLSNGMWVSEGQHQISWGKPVSFGAGLSGETPSPLPGGIGMKPSAWKITPAEGGLRLEYEGEGPEFNLRTSYLVRPDATVDAEVAVIPREASEPVVGQLYMALGAPKAGRWLVHGLEGDVGGPFFVRHPSAIEYTGKYWHPIERLWEGAVQPLSLDRPALGWQVGRHWLWMEMTPYPGTTFDDLYLREYLPDARPGLAAYLAWMAGRHGRALDPKKPFAARFRLFIDHEPKAEAPRLPVRFWADGANWWVENGHYRACIGRSAGGQLRELWPAGSSQALVENGKIYTDFGILASGNNSLGQKIQTTGSTESDLEPDSYVEPGAKELTLRFRSFLRTGEWTTITSPRVEYETVWHFDAGPKIRVEVRARPLIEPRPDDRAFLAQVLSVPGVTGWRAVAGGKTYSGAPATDVGERVFQSATAGARAERLTLKAAGGQAVIDGFKPWGQAPQDVFLLKGSDGTYTAFLAMLDGKPVDLDARWRGLSYDLEVTRP